MSPEEVNGLLKASLAAHEAAKQVIRVIGGKRQIVRGRDLAKLKEAAELRAQAEALDPKREASGWSEEQSRTPARLDTHTTLTEFYREKLRG